MLIDVTYGQPGPGIGADARAAEALGFDGCWVGETTADPFLRAQTACDHTTAITIGTAVAIAFARTPMTVAYSGHDLAATSRGRFVLGLGAQVKAHIERRFSMPWTQPVPRMREFILAVRAIWEAWQNETRLSFEGDFYTHTLMVPFFAPTPHQWGSPPVFLAAVGEEMTAVAGEVADGLIFHPFTTAAYLREVTLPAVERGRARVTRPVSDTFSVGGPVFTCVGRDDAELERAVTASRRQLAFYASTPSYRQVLALHGWGDLQPELTRLSKAGDWDAMGALIDDEVLETFAVIGRPTEVARQLAERWGSLTDRISLYTPYEVPADTLAEVISAREA